MQEYAKHIVQNGSLYLPLEEYPQEKKYVYIVEVGQSLEESLRGGKLVQPRRVL